jgi:hypothetical protein
MPVEIHGKQYATVNERIEELHKKYNGCVSINTELLETQGDVVRMKAIVELKEMVEGQEVASNTFTGHAEEVIGSSMINKTSALENAETSAVGRALAFAGFQTDASIASADEVANAIVQQNSMTRVVNQSQPNKASDFDPIEELSKEVEDNWSEYRNNPIDFGKHNGTPWKDISDGYLAWLAGTRSDKNPKNNQMAGLEMNYRANDALASVSISEPVKEKKQTQSDTIKMDDAIESLFDD